MRLSQLTVFDPRRVVICDVLDEIERQDEKWGEQNPPDFAAMPPRERAEYHEIPEEVVARHNCEERARAGNVTWADILIEELCGAVACDNRYHLRTELVQVAAVVHQWIAAIDRRERIVCEAHEEAM